MEYLHNTIELNNPHLLPNRVRHHTNLLRRLFQSAHEKTTPLNTDWFKNEMAVILHLAELDNPKLYLPSLIALFPRNHNYRNAMMIDSKVRKKTVDEIEDAYSMMREDIAPIMEYSGLIGQRDYIRLQDYAICSLLCGLYIPIFRIREIASLKIRNYNRVVDNYYDGMVLGIQHPFFQEITVGEDLKLILDKLTAHTPVDFLFSIGDERLPIQRFNYILRNTFGIGVIELFKTRLDYFPFGVIPDFCDDAT
jgi:hypothetical protein